MVKANSNVSFWFSSSSNGRPFLRSLFYWDQPESIPLKFSLFIKSKIYESMYFFASDNFLQEMHTWYFWFENKVLTFAAWYVWEQSSDDLEYDCSKITFKKDADVLPVVFCFTKKIKTNVCENRLVFHRVKEIYDVKEKSEKLTTLILASCTWKAKRKIYYEKRKNKGL